MIMSGSGGVSSSVPNQTTNVPSDSSARSFPSFPTKATDCLASAASSPAPTSKEHCPRKSSLVMSSSSTSTRSLQPSAGIETSSTSFHDGASDDLTTAVFKPSAVSLSM